MTSWSYFNDVFSGGVPGTCVAKSKVSVSHALATVVSTSISTLLLGLFGSSCARTSLRRTGMPAAGEYTRTVMRVSVAVNGTMPTVGPTVPTTVPAYVKVVSADLLTRATLLVPPAGSACTEESSAPAKPRSV